MKQQLEKLLAALSRKILKKYHPRVIGITGSVGKTSTKEAVFFVAAERFRVYRPSKNFNNEFGMPLAIIGIKDSPGKNVFGWLVVIAKALGLILFRQKYPEVLVLEYGVDKPGDMDYLLAIVRPDIAILTRIGVSHYEFFKDEAVIELEKGKLIAALPPSGTAILNADDIKVLAQAGKTKAKILTYGITEPADVRLENNTETLTVNAVSNLKIKTPGGEIKVALRALGVPHVASCLAAVAVGIALGVEPGAIALGLEQYRPQPGRLNIIAGIKHSIIIDDTYNAAPDSMRQALELFERFPGNYKIAVLGSMRELGSLEQQAHEEIGKLVAKINPDYLVTVAAGGNIIADSAKQAGMPGERVLSFDSSNEAKKTVQNLLQPESLVLAKGSQNFVRLEHIVKEIMAEPMRAEELLARQDKRWLAKA